MRVFSKIQLSARLLRQHPAFCLESESDVFEKSECMVVEAFFGLTTIIAILRENEDASRASIAMDVHIGP